MLYGTAFLQVFKQALMMKAAHVNDQFRSLQAYFKLTRELFEKARTLQEKHELLAISPEIISEAKLQMAEFKADSTTPDLTRVKKRDTKNERRRIEVP